MKPRTCAGILASIGLMVWNPVAFLALGVVGGILLAGKLARRLGKWNRRRQVLSPSPRVVYDPQTWAEIPIEQRDWVRRNLN